MNFEQFFARLKSATAALTAGQVMSLALAFVAVVGLTIGSAYYLNTPNYGVLFADMEPDAASSIVTKLKNDKVQYVLDEGGRTVRVPAARVDELRMQYASDGGLSSSTGGYFLFDRTNFGQTEFVEQVNYRRALEGELARTIGSIGEVASARVHIALPQRSVFTDRDQTTKASVILKLRSNRRLAAPTVDGITNLVAASVESLRPESVVIMDTFGRPLSKPEPGDDPVATQHLERQQRIERDLVAKIVAMVSPVVGEGHVRANVSVKLDAASEETIEDTYDPDPVVRSKQVISAGSTGATAGMLAPPSTLAPLQAGGVAGTRANLPVSPAQGGAAAAPETTVAVAPTPAQTTNTSESTNYEVGHKNTHRIAPAGDIAKLSVAVLVDGDRPASADGSTPAKTLDVQKIHGLVSAAVGFDADRGDQITVENIPFEETPAEEMITPGVWQRYGPQAFEGFRIVGVVTLAALAIFMVILPMARGALAATPQMPQAALARRAAVVAAVANAGPGPRTVQDIEAEMDAQLEATDAQRLPVLTKRMAALTQKEPENAAKLLRTWLSEGK